MNLRRCFPFHQLLFLPAILSILVIEARAEEKVTYKDGRTQIVNIAGVSGPNLQIKLAAGTISIPLATVAQVEMAPPADFKAGMASYEAKAYAKALASISVVVSKYKGLPVNWAQQAMLTVGDIYVALNDLPKAEAAYNEFQKSYAGQGLSQAATGMARIAISKKDFASAKARLEPIVERALKEKTVPKDSAETYSQAFYLLGQIKESEGDFSGALEDYLRTVTLFHHDRIAASAAQERADALRKEHSGIAVP